MNCGCDNQNKFQRIGTIACPPTGNLIENSNNFGCNCKEDTLTQIKGVCKPEDFPTLAATDTTWTQLFIPEILCIPPQKPDVEQILSVNAQLEIISQRVIKTPKASEPNPTDPTKEILFENAEGLFSTGRKLVIEGLLRQKIVYTANVKEQSVHAAHFDVPFSAFIILPDPSVIETLGAKYKIEACIEDIYICRVTLRQIFKNITLFIKASDPKF